MSNANCSAMIWILGLLSMYFITKNSVVAEEGQEIAKFASCSQSSLFARYATCHHATDGEYGDCGYRRTTHTLKESKSWWKGNLYEPTPIAKVRIIGRSDARATLNRLHDFKIMLDGGHVCAEYPSQERVFDKTFSCVGVSTEVKVQLNGNDHLSLCEVIVYRQVREIAKFVSCSQSSVHQSYHTCDKAMDGKYAYCDWEGLSHTIRESKSWWKGQLTGPTAIEKVRIIGRIDGELGRIAVLGVLNENKLQNFKIILDGGQVCAEYPSHEILIEKTFSCVGVTTEVKVQMNGNDFLCLCEVIVYKQEITSTISTDEGNTTTSQNDKNSNMRKLFIIILPCTAGGLVVLLILFCIYAKCRMKMKKKKSEALNDELNKEKQKEEERERKKLKKRSKKLQGRMRDNADDSNSDKSGKSKATNRSGQSSKSSGSAKSSDSTNI